MKKIIALVVLALIAVLILRKRESAGLAQWRELGETPVPEPTGWAGDNEPVPSDER